MTAFVTLQEIHWYIQWDNTLANSIVNLLYVQLNYKPRLSVTFTFTNNYSKWVSRCNISVSFEYLHKNLICLLTGLLLNESFHLIYLQNSFPNAYFDIAVLHTCFSTSSSDKAIFNNIYKLLISVFRKTTLSCDLHPLVIKQLIIAHAHYSNIFWR